MRIRLSTVAFVILSLLYFTLVMVLPTDPHTLDKYNITQVHARLLNLTVIIPLIGVWLTALYGFKRFRDYAELVQGSVEGQPLAKLAKGLMTLVFSLPVTAIISTIIGYVAQENPHLVPTAAIIRTYTGLLFSLVAYYFLSYGAQGLVRTLRPKGLEPRLFMQYRLPVAIAFSSIFTWFIVSRPLSHQAGANIYYLPVWLIVLSVAIPYLYAWYQGSVATAYLYLYTLQVKGTIYKQAFGGLAKGVGTVVVMSILVQLITILSERLNRLNLTPILLIIYLLVICYAIGYVFVARGANKLKRIEEV